MALNAIISSIFKRGTLGRYALTGLFNGSIFWIGWEIARIFSDGSTLQENMSWAIAWTLSSAVAFFTHNKFTFTSHGNPNKMFVATFMTYMITVACSTTSYDFFVGIIDIPRVVGFGNLLIWGIIDWAILRWMIFKHVVDILPAKEPLEEISLLPSSS